MQPLLLFASFLLSAAAGAGSAADPLPERLASVRPGPADAAECDRRFALAATLNGPDLLRAAALCQAADKPVEGNVLLNAGQVRSTADMALMVPESKADSDAQTSLYGLIYFRAGGPGREEVFRQARSRDLFFSLFDGWAPLYPPDYDPGWNTRRRPDGAAYQQAMAEIKAARRRQLVDIGRLYADETYYALHRRHQDLQARNPNGFVEGTADARSSHELLRRMDERSAALIPDQPPAEEAADLADVRFPPAGPAPDETAATGPVDPAVRHCADLAERTTISQGSRIVRVLVTRSPEWGTIWRADIAGDDMPAERFTCTGNTSSSRPLDMADEPLAPLPEAPAAPRAPR